MRFSNFEDELVERDSVYAYSYCATRAISWLRKTNGPRRHHSQSAWTTLAY